MYEVSHLPLLTSFITMCFLPRMPMVVAVGIPTETAVQVPDVTHPAEDFYQPCVVVRARTQSTRSCTSSTDDGV